MELAESDPSRALALAGRERFLVDQQLMKLAAIEGWARQDASAAMAAALGFESGEREAAIKAALTGAARDPSAALSAMGLLRADERVSDQVLLRAQLAMVGALSGEGHFQAAVDFAREEADTRNRDALLKSGFAQWSRYEPESAVLAAMELEDRSAREEVYSVVTSAWSGVDPAGLAGFAAQLPEGKERSLAMTRALQQWVAFAPTEAADWLDGRGPAKELDVGVLALATHPYLAERSPEVAVSWAESLWDSNLRADTLAIVVKQWAATDRQSAIDYVRSTPELGLPERQELLSLFGERKEFGIDGPLR